jgi:hypothetical protein
VVYYITARWQFAHRAQGCHKPNVTIDFSKLDIRDGIWPKVLQANARKLLGDVSVMNSG